VSGDGRVSWLLRPIENERGTYWIGNSRIDADLSLNNLVLKAHARDDGVLVLTAEPFGERGESKKKNQKT
jgi:hypothetical protein